MFRERLNINLAEVLASSERFSVGCGKVAGKHVIGALQCPGSVCSGGL